MASNGGIVSLVQQQLERIERAMYRGSGHSHWDSTMQHGAGCVTCHEGIAGRDEMKAAVAEIRRLLDDI